MRMLLVVLIAVGGIANAAGIATGSVPSPMDRLTGLVQPAQGFDCANVSCKRLGSCAEACHKLLVCGQRVRDGDNDGIPCENLCSRRC